MAVVVDVFVVVVVAADSRRPCRDIPCISLRMVAARGKIVGVHAGGNGAGEKKVPEKRKALLIWYGGGLYREKAFGLGGG